MTTTDTPTGFAKAITLGGAHLRPAGSVALGAANNPTTGDPGELLYFPRTGRYAMHCCGGLAPVPQRWARGVHRAQRQNAADTRPFTDADREAWGAQCDRLEKVAAEVLRTARAFARRDSLDAGEILQTALDLLAGAGD